MEFQNLIETYSPFVKRHFLPLILGLLGLMFLIYGLISLLSAKNPSSDASFEPDNSSTESAQVSADKIAVDVEGAVVKSGVFKFSQDSIIQDALAASGGLSSNADRAWVEKNINLAQKLLDGMKIYIPFVGDSTINSNTNSSSQISASGLISINTATEGQLDSLPGIGPVTAQKIIKGRPYSALNELLDKKIVSSKVFEEIKDKISLY